MDDKTAPDPVNPSYYRGDTVMRIIEDFDLGFCLGNVIKYVLRHENRSGLVDLRKARWYLDREITRREAQAQASIYANVVDTPPQDGADTVAIARYNAARSLRLKANSLKHGPRGSGLAGPCDPDCRKCEIERELAELKEEVAK